MYIVCLVFFGDFKGCHSVGAMFRLFRDEVDYDTSVCCRGFRMVWKRGGVEVGGGGGGEGGQGGWEGVDSDTWSSYKATSCLGRLSRLLVSPLNVLPLIVAWRLQWSSEKDVPISPPSTSVVPK